MRRTHCKRGHALDGDNLYTSPSGERGCKACRRKSSLDSHRRNPSQQKQQIRDWAKRNPERIKAYNLKHSYGISLEEFNAKVETQNGCCKVCNRLMESPHVDHDHLTDQVRDLLCKECNFALGLLHDDLHVAESLVEYLRRWKA